MIIDLELTKISEILVPISRPVPVDPLKEYPLLGIRLDSGGVFHRETKLGSQIAATTLYQVKVGDFIYSRLFAWRGAFGMINQDFDGYYVSGEFPMFTPIQDKIDIKYLLFWFRLPRILSRIETDCTGSTPLTRNRFKENFFLALEIPLPPLKEQRRIVARIEELAAKIEEARGLRREIVGEAEVVINIVAQSKFNELNQYNPIRPLKKSAKIVGGGTPSKANYTYWEGTIPWVSPKDMKVRNLYDTEDHISDLVLRSGIASLIPKDSVLIVVRSGILRRTIPVSINRVPVTINQDMKALIPSEDILCDFLAWWFKGKESDILANVKGGTTVQSIVWDNVIELDICVPTLAEQHHIVTYLNDLQAKVDSLKELQSETATELNALLPSILDKAFKGEL